MNYFYRGRTPVWAKSLHLTIIGGHTQEEKSLKTHFMLGGMVINAKPFTFAVPRSIMTRFQAVSSQPMLLPRYYTMKRRET